MSEADLLPSSRSETERRASDDTAASVWSSFAEYSPFRAAFRDRSLEKAYRRHLATSALPEARRIWLIMSFAYLGFGVLDLFTISGDALAAILTVRCLIFTPIALGLFLLSYVERTKFFAGYYFAFGVFLSGISIVWMISIMPPEGAPPYIIGVLIVFIFAASNVRMPFPAATAAFSLTTIAYALVLISNPKFTHTEIISGLFFMISGASAAMLTNFVQEIRLRMIWIQKERRRADAMRIEELMIEATASDQSKINFLSILSHELRTPLHQIIGFSEVLRAPGAAEEAAKRGEYLDEIHSSAHRLLSSIAKMLRYADATAGKISYALDDYPVTEIITLACEQFASRAAQREIAIDLGGVESGTLNIDQASTVYALGCLIDNAINASPARSRVTINGRNRNDGRYELTITDRGIGMTNDQIRLAFQPFSQTGHARTRAAEGVGLGLTLARKILTDQKAELSLESEPGKGVAARILFAARAQQTAAA